MFQHEIDAMTEEERKSYLRHNYLMRTMPQRIKEDRKHKSAHLEHFAVAFGYADVKEVKARIAKVKRQRRPAKPKPAGKTKRTSR